MLIKEKDGIELQLEELHHLLGTAKLSAGQRDEVQDEIKQTKTGAQGEEKAAYYINFKLRDSNNYAVLHDLRLEHEGGVAQIDHLLIDRFLDVILIESRNVTTALRVNEHGEFEIRTRSFWKGIESPVERSQRHALVVEAIINALDLAPRRMGIPISRNYHHWVLVSPECSLLRPTGEQNILKMDQFGTRLDQFGHENGNPLGVAKLISPETLREFAQRLAAQHRPSAPDYAARFGIDPLPKKSGSAWRPGANSRGCAGCGAPLDSKVVFFCRINAGRFEGKLLCRPCQAAMAITHNCT
ncbi:MAG: NERD domain-containing protein, partial [Verrucomicrobia bacterium]|nr:NERD domain-containing protein [Verrucomicrobiota bacterium]